MARRARLAIAGIPWHIIHRGSNRGACFFTRSDYSRYLEILGEQAEKFGCLLHAFVLMTNHVHLLITPARADSAAWMMKNVAQRHTQFINHRDGRSGPLWEGRFKSCLAQDEAYVLTCYRYIELNPVRAGMVTSPEAYRWSSFSANGYGKLNSLITPHPDYLALGTHTDERAARYRKLIASSIADPQLQTIRRATNGNYALGTEEFLASLAQQTKRQVTPIRQPKSATRIGDRPLTAQRLIS